METNHEYKGFLGCFPDIIGAHKVGEGTLFWGFFWKGGSSNGAVGKIYSLSRSMVLYICAAAWLLVSETLSFCENVF